MGCGKCCGLGLVCVADSVVCVSGMQEDRVLVVCFYQYKNTHLVWLSVSYGYKPPSVYYRLPGVSEKKDENTSARRFKAIDVIIYSTSFLLIT